MHFGEPLGPERLRALLRPGEGIDTVMSADVYGEGEGDRALADASAGCDRESFCLVGAIGHDFYTGTREGAKGFPRFTDPRLRAEREYAAYIRMATERSLERCGTDRFDLLLLHNPDRVGYSSPAVWEGMQAVREAGLTRLLGVAPGPANGFTLDLIGCPERFGGLIDWAMIILRPPAPDRGQARRAGRGAQRPRADRRGGGRDPRDRRQQRLHDVEGRERRVRGSPGPGSLGDRRRAGGGRPALEHRPGARPGCSL